MLALFALTYALQSYDFWIHDNELYGEGGALEDALLLLATAWEKLLDYDDAKLGIDTEFSRAGRILFYFIDCGLIIYNYLLFSYYLFYVYVFLYL